MSAFDQILVSAEGFQRLDSLRKSFSDLLDDIEEATPLPSREKSLAITALEEASMWASKAVAKDNRS